MNELHHQLQRLDKNIFKKAYGLKAFYQKKGY